MGEKPGGEAWPPVSLSHLGLTWRLWTRAALPFLHSPGPCALLTHMVMRDPFYFSHMNVLKEFQMVSKDGMGTSLVAQWLRIRLSMQGTQVRALVREDPTCCGAAKPVRHNYWSPHSATRKATAMRSLRTTTKSSPRSPQLEKACTQQRRPNTAKNKIK